MKNLLFTSLVFATVACGAHQSSEGYKHAENERNTPIVAVAHYNPRIHVLGDETEWKALRKNILYTKVSSSPAFLTAAGERSPEWDAEKVLGTLHTWFTEGTGYTKVNRAHAGLLYLRPIPNQVLQEIYSRLSVTPTGFGILDVNHWKTIKQLQMQNYKVAVITNYPVAIAGLNISAERVIAFDVLANSGTLAHEARHQKQFDLLGPKAFFHDVSPKCKAKLSNYFAELDATTAQLPEWATVLRSAEIQVESLVHFDETGGPSTAPTLMRALSANLEYPIARAMVVLDEPKDESTSFWENRGDCSQTIRDIVTNIQELAMQQKRQLIASEHAKILKGKLRFETADLLEARFNCGDAQAANCQQIDARLLEIGTLVADAKEKTAELLESAYEERRRVMPTLLQKLNRRELKELCNEVMGVALMLDCRGYR